MSTKIEREKEDLFYKNLKKDIQLKEILQELIKVDGEKNRTEIYKKHLKKILESIEENKSYSIEIKENILSNNPWLKVTWNPQFFLTKYYNLKTNFQDFCLSS